jgi:hypothetical protein
MADTKSIGQATAEGFARTQNQPIPQLRHDPFAGGSIHVNDTAPIAPATGPCAVDERPDMAQVHLEIDRDKARE